MAIGHDHSHHEHESGKPNHSKAFAVGIGLNLSFVVIEGVYGSLANSLALLADAGHNLSDVLGLALAWGASYLALKRPDSKFSYGLKSSSIMAALLNAVFLLVAIGGILWESVQRFIHPDPIQGSTVMIVAAVGVLINGATAFLFISGQKADINIRGAFLHMAGDALISLGVVLAGFIYLKTGWLLIDPILGIGISILIVVGTIGLLKEALSLSLHAVPKGINFDEVRSFLESVREVKAVHDLHVWGMSTTDAALTCHLVMAEPDRFLRQGHLHELLHELEEKFHIEHSTIQLDRIEDVNDCVNDCERMGENHEKI